MSCEGLRPAGLQMAGLSLAKGELGGLRQHLVTHQGPVPGESPHTLITRHLGGRQMSLPALGNQGPQGTR